MQESQPPVDGELKCAGKEATFINRSKLKKSEVIFPNYVCEYRQSRWLKKLVLVKSKGAKQDISNCLFSIGYYNRGLSKSFELLQAGEALKGTESLKRLGIKKHENSLIRNFRKSVQSSFLLATALSPSMPTELINNFYQHRNY